MKGGENVTVGGEYHVVTDVRNVTVYGRSNNVSDCPNGYGRGNVNGLGLSVSGCDNSFDVIGSYLTVLSSNYSEVHGTCVSIAKQNACFVWSGKTVSKEEDKYGYAEGEDGSRIAKFPNGSFCINPNNGINQVFIGDKSLSTIIKEAIDQGLKDAMS